MSGDKIVLSITRVKKNKSIVTKKKVKNTKYKN